MPRQPTGQNQQRKWRKCATSHDERHSVSLTWELYMRWRQVGVQQGLKTGTKVARFLLDRYEEERAGLRAAHCAGCMAPLHSLCAQCQLQGQEASLSAGQSTTGKGFFVSPAGPVKTEEGSDVLAQDLGRPRRRHRTSVRFSAEDSTAVNPFQTLSHATQPKGSKKRTKRVKPSAAGNSPCGGPAGVMRSRMPAGPLQEGALTDDKGLIKVQAETDPGATELQNVVIKSEPVADNNTELAPDVKTLVVQTADVGTSEVSHNELPTDSASPRLHLAATDDVNDHDDCEVCEDIGDVCEDSGIVCQDGTEPGDSPRMVLDLSDMREIQSLAVHSDHFLRAAQDKFLSVAKEGLHTSKEGLNAQGVNGDINPLCHTTPSLQLHINDIVVNGVSLVTFGTPSTHSSPQVTQAVTHASGGRRRVKCVKSGEQKAERRDTPKLCEYCGEYFVRTDAFRLHRWSHQGLKPYACDVCGKTYRSRSVLNNHKLLHSDVKKYVCELCATSFKQVASLIRHRHMHSGFKKFKCGQCHAAFATRRQLDQHQSVHTDLRLYQCETCSRMFKDKETLRKHRLIHRERQRHMCGQCGSVHVNLQNFKRHLREHCDRAFPCPHCGRAFLRKEHMKRHCGTAHAATAGSKR